MPDKIKNGLFIFHRDLRIVDNIGLLEASSRCEHLYTCFIFTPEQVGPTNSYRSDSAITFMIESLDELKDDIRKAGGELILIYGKTTDLVEKLIKKLEIGGVFFNKDYSPYAIERDNELSRMCSNIAVPIERREKENIICEMFSDYYLYEPGTVVTGGGKAYKKFTPFYDTVRGNKVLSPRASPSRWNLRATKVSIGSPLPSFLTVKKKDHTSLDVPGGRTAAKARLQNACREQKHYEKGRDEFTYQTTYLSAYIKFGCVSIREVYSAFKERGYHDIIRELIWREFFAHVLFSYPEVLNGSYQPRFKHIPWRKSAADFNKWKKGETGFPIVDACMRQLNQTGYMHNRGRMVVASFLIKVLLLDWRLGERYFAQQLRDYDPASNNGNWQGISGTGVDMKPYFRDMNPWIQGAKFDKDGAFIKKWVPELKDVQSKDIHRWNETCEENRKRGIKYPCPMVDYAEQKEKMLRLYQ